LLVYNSAEPGIS